MAAGASAGADASSVGDVHQQAEPVGVSTNKVDYAVSQAEGEGEMKAITLHQPWASLIAYGLKEFETRSWTTPYRGPLAIHAGSGKQGYTAEGWHALEYLRAGFGSDLARVNFPAELPFGAVVCVCELRAIYRTDAVKDHISMLELAVGNFAPGRAAWQMVNVKRLPVPVAARGQQGLWEWVQE